MVDTEEYFPRGGKKPTTTYFKQSGNFLGAAEKGEKKRKKQKKKSEDDDGYLSDNDIKNIDKSIKNCATRLSYITVKKGVAVLGRVSQVHETKLIVCLPGNMIGTVMACHISEAYNKLLEAYVNDQTEKIKELPEMFRPGQYVAVKVLEVEGTKLMLSMMPQHINTGRKHSDVFKGDVFQAAVSSVEDHGCVMDIGIPNTRPFLPKKNINPEIELDAGMITWCCVKEVTSSSESSIVTLSNELSAIQNASPRRNPSLPLLPATLVYFIVDEPLDNGIEGHIFDETTSYIQRYHADKVKGKKPAVGQKVKARVLYVMPTRNTPFLTMKDVFSVTHPDLKEEQLLKQGDIVEEAQVLRILGRGVHFKLAKGCLGVMTVKHIQTDEDLDDQYIIAKSYPIGSKHRVRVLVYHQSDYVYLVSDNSAVLQLKYFSLDQLQPGDLVDATIKTVADDHILVNVDRLTGYIPQTHFSDAGVFIDPKKAPRHKLSRKFKVGQELRARVLVIDRERQGLLLTLKPSFLAEGLEVLSSYEQAQIGKAYTGTIRMVRDYILVNFFNGVTAIVPRQYVTKEPLDNLAEAFHHGQIVNCTILRVDAENKKMSGSLTTAPFWPESKRENKGKRKNTSVDPDETPHKKEKKNKEDTETHEKTHRKKKSEDSVEAGDGQEMKKKKDKKRQDSENNEEENDNKEQKKNKKSKKLKAESNESDIHNDKEENKKNKKMKIIKEVKKSSEESDAIKSDIHEDSDQVLTPQDLHLIDLSDCNDIHMCKRRIVSLMKNINGRMRRIDKIDGKILKIESKGLTAKNKKNHTAMHMEKLAIEVRTKKFLEALKNVQEKLIELGYKKEEDPKYNKEKKAKKMKKEIEGHENAEASEGVEEKVKAEKRKNREKKETKDKKKRENVESLEPVLEVPSAKDFWSTSADLEVDNAPEEESSSSSSDDEEREQPKKKRKKLTVAEKLAKVREEEEKVRELEKRAIESESAPRSSEQFERALLANPDCSQLWIAYMAFHLQSTELDKARAVGRRALRTIGFREDSERLNVWLALLNCETRFGTKESQQTVLEEALQMNDPLQLHSKLLEMYVETSKQQELSSLVDLMVRKYRREPRVYERCGAACFKLGLVDRARQIMQRAISVLDKKEHVSVLVQFALMERDAGERERAEALFEQVLAVYPQRVDVCATYLDMLRKGGDLQHIRQVMERMTAQKLPARKMKILYKKWIEVEEKIGDEDKVEEIRQRAMKYIEKAKF